jgi:hypothetical protein
MSTEYSAGPFFEQGALYPFGVSALFNRAVLSAPYFVGKQRRVKLSGRDRRGLESRKASTIL